MFPAILTVATLGVPATLGLAMFAASGSPRGSMLPDVQFPIGNPLTEEKRVLGKILFYDEQLSTDNTVACASCHTQTAGGADRRRVRQPGPDGLIDTDDDIFGSPGVINQNDDLDYAAHPVFGLNRQVTGRAAPSVINSGHALEIFWDGRANDAFIDPDTGETLLAGFAALENQAVNPPLTTTEMAHHGRDWGHITAKLAHARPLALASDVPPDMADAALDARTYPELFRRAFGDTEITAARIAMAIATYERTLVADQTPWDAFVLGDPTAMTQAEQRGWDAFEAVRCTVCHVPSLFTDNGFANIGVRPVAEDRGRQNVTGLHADRGRFKTPGLRNVGLKSSFMHNGQYTSLREVVDHYADPKQFNENLDGFANVNLNSQQRADMTVFLENALTDPRVANGEFPFDAATLYFNPANAPNPAVIPDTGRPDAQGVLPRIIAVAPPLIGADDFRVGLTQVPAGASAVLHVSFDPPADGVVAPDTVLGPFIAASPDPLLPAAATAHWPVPFAPVLDGRTVYMQWVVDDPGAAEPALSRVAAATFLCGFGDCATGCLPDLNRDQAVDFNDLAAFLQAFNSQDRAADLAEPLGAFNFFDLAEFVAAFNRGCP
jgi:cytochrome c peroxidase